MPATLNFVLGNQQPETPLPRLREVRPRKTSWLPTFKFFKSPSFTAAVCLIALLAAGGYLSGPLTTTLVNSVASLTSDLSRITSTGVNATLAFSEVALAVSRASIGMFGEAWAGIDVLQARATIEGAKWVMHRSLDPYQFLNSSFGRELVPVTDRQREVMARAVLKVGPELPSLARTSATFISNTSYEEFSFKLLHLHHDFLAVQTVVINVSFRLQWANPCWELLQFDPSAEISSIKQRIHDSIADVITSEWVATSLTGADVDRVLTLHLTWYSLASYKAMQWWFGDVNR